ITTGTGTVAGCLQVNIGGTNYLLPYYAAASSSVMPTPPSGATQYSNLQVLAGNPGVWQPCIGVCAGSTDNSSGTSSLTYGYATPSRSGASMKEVSTTTVSGHTWNTMYYRHLTCASLPGGFCTGIKHMMSDFWFWIDSSSTNLNTVEYDPHLYPGDGYKYSMSMQCQSSSGGFWRFWNQG